MKFDMSPDYVILFERLFDNSPEGVVIQGLDGVVYKANRLSARCSDTPLKKLSGKTRQPRWPPTRT
jgi:hypothetical protein